MLGQPARVEHLPRRRVRLLDEERRSRRADCYDARLARRPHCAPPGGAGEVIRIFSASADWKQRFSEGTAAGIGLSVRELEVLTLVAQGKSNKEIARALSISIRTAQNHLANMFRKLDLNDRVAVALYAINVGIAQPSAAKGPEMARLHV
jgi:DNA-binding CsgD family transcriptional regulator